MLSNIHFLTKEKLSSFVDCGMGAIYSVDRFPSKGTHFNGQYYVGLGSIIDFAKIQSDSYDVDIFIHQMAGG